MLDTLMLNITQIKNQEQSESLSLPKSLDYSIVPGLSNEAKEKLIEIKPETLGQASEYQVLPSAINQVLIYLKRTA